MSEKMAVPPNTSTVPSQWVIVNGLLKYQMLKSSETNFLKVTTKVTVKDEHSVVRTNTALMQTDLLLKRKPMNKTSFKI